MKIDVIIPTSFSPNTIEVVDDSVIMSFTDAGANSSAGGPVTDQALKYYAKHDIDLVKVVANRDLSFIPIPADSTGPLLDTLSDPTGFLPGSPVISTPEVLQHD